MFGKAQHAVIHLTQIALAVYTVIAAHLHALPPDAANVLETSIEGFALAHLGSFFHAAWVARAESIAHAAAADAERAASVVQGLGAAVDQGIAYLRSQSAGASGGGGGGASPGPDVGAILSTIDQLVADVGALKGKVLPAATGAK